MTWKLGFQLHQPGTETEEMSGPEGLHMRTVNNLAVMSEDEYPKAPDIRREGEIVRIMVI